ncbi:hypothetical protein [Kaarinaea lacus]
MANAKRLATSSSIAKKIQIATENLILAKQDGEVSASSLEKDRKKFLADNKRLSKKRAVLTKKKKIAANRLKKDPNTENRKVASSIVKELAVVKKAGDKARAISSVNAEELKSVKASLKQASAYLAGIEKADKQLNKPQKKKRRAKKRVAVMA